MPAEEDAEPTGTARGLPGQSADAGAAMAAPSLGSTVAAVASGLGDVHRARESGLASCRLAIRLAGSSIRAVHREQPERAAELLAQCEGAIRAAQGVLGPYPEVAHAGFLHDAEKEMAEAVLTACLVSGSPLPSPEQLSIGVPAWLNGLAEAASELRRHLLDCLRDGRSGVAESLLSTMEEVYEALVAIDYPDALTAGLRRSADALRAVLERTRSDVTTTILQQRLQRAIESRLDVVDDAGGGGRR